ncbi:MAG: acyl carrier protein [Christensenella sp.]|nr:MAG: acyl carrier protein [Christensenella sp.]
MATQFTKEQIQSNIAKLVKQYIPSLQNEEITRETPINSKGYESLNYILIICTLESDYGVKIPDKVWMKLDTVGDVVDTVYDMAEKKSK